LFDTFTKLPVLALEGENGVLEVTGEGKDLSLPENFDTDYAIVKVADFTKTKTDLSTATTEKQALEKDAAVGKSYISMKRAEAIRLYTLHSEGKPDAAVIKLMNEADSDAVDGLLNLHAKGATGKFKAHCKACNSSEVEFRSSLTVEEQEKNEETQAVTTVQSASFDEIYQSKNTRGMGIRLN
jgi:hypothetical protein